MSKSNKQTGIRQKPNGKFQACKHLRGKRYYKEFNSKREASQWRNEFHPLLSPEPTIQRSIQTLERVNGRDHCITFGEVVEKYKIGFMKTLSAYTQYKKLLRISRYLSPLFQRPMGTMTPEVISAHIEDMKLLVDEKSKRCNFEKELKDLSSICTWYSEYCDFTFVNPVKKPHFKQGKLREIREKQRALTPDQFTLFLEKLEEPFQSLALIQTYLAGRIQEAAALNDRTVDFQKRTISVSEKIVWLKGKPTHHYGTKTGATALVKMNDEMYERLTRLKEKRPLSCKYFFHHKGKPLRYDMIRLKYNEALQQAGLTEFSGTNTLRHTMATLSREIGGLDASQALLRHSSARMTERYAKLAVNEKVSQVVNEAQELFKIARERKLLGHATKRDQLELE